MTFVKQPRMAIEDAAVPKLAGQLSSNRAPDNGDQSKTQFGLCPSKPRDLALAVLSKLEGGGVVKSLRGFACGPVALIRMQKV